MIRPLTGAPAGICIRDTFFRPDGPLGGSWLPSPTWTVVDCKAINTPVLGPELVANGAMEADGSWGNYNAPTINERSGELVHSGSWSRKVVTPGNLNQGISQTVVGSVGQWYQMFASIASIEGGSVRLNWESRVWAQTKVQGEYQNFIVTDHKINPSNGFYLYTAAGSGGTFYADDISVRAITSHCGVFLSPTCHNAIISCAARITPGTQAGIWACADVGHTVGLLGFHDGQRAALYQLVSGVWTQLISENVTYVDGGAIEVRVMADKVQLWYAGIQVGVQQTMNAALAANDIHGMFSTFAGNELLGFELAPNSIPLPSLPDNATQRFVWLSDTHVDGGSNQAKLSALVGQINAMQPAPEVVIITGDLTNGTTESQYSSAVSILNGLHMPWHAIPGNHDQGEQGWPWWHANFPEDHFVVDMGEFRIIGFLTDEMDYIEALAGGVSSDELIWLEGQLFTATEEGKNIILATHFPLHNLRTDNHIVLPDYGGIALEELLETYTVRAFLAGHVHQDCDAALGFGPTIYVNGPSIPATTSNPAGGYVVCNIFGYRLEFDYRSLSNYQSVPYTGAPCFTSIGIDGGPL
jgi:Icc-related predicted phosphoesterase